MEKAPRTLRALLALALAAGSLAACSIEGTRRLGETCLASRECADGLVCEFAPSGVSRCVDRADGSVIPREDVTAVDAQDASLDAVTGDLPQPTDTGAPPDTARDGDTSEAPPQDAPASDTGARTDTGQPDTGQPDSGPPDAGQPDAGQPDAGQPDTGPGDTGAEPG